MITVPYGRQTIERDDIEAVSEALTHPLITTGPLTKAFEEALCAYTGAPYCIAVSNATAALHLASLALLSAGERVLTTPNSFLATSNAILYADAKPVFVDICDDGNIDLDLCEKLLEKDSTIKAIYGVAFSGKMLDQEKLHRLRSRFGVVILEDCAHAIGASAGEIKAGSCANSDITIFSFHPVKNMTTGEGGAIMTRDKRLYEKLLSLRNHGMEKRNDIAPWYYEMTALGYNYRITDFQCALGLSQLRKLDGFIAHRRQLVRQYEKAFEGSVMKPLYPYDAGSAYHLFVVKIDFEKLKIEKKAFFEMMISKGIGIMVHYIPINKQPYYRELGYGSEHTPIMDRYYEQCLSLPLFPSLTDEDQKYVMKTLFEVLNV